jgi:hypothetical protein
MRNNCYLDRAKIKKREKIITSYSSPPLLLPSFIFKFGKGKKHSILNSWKNIISSRSEVL